MIKQKLYQQVAESIATAIAKGRYAPGSRLPAERDLAEDFKVSRPTIREAMIALDFTGKSTSSACAAAARQASIAAIQGERHMVVSLAAGSAPVGNHPRVTAPALPLPATGGAGEPTNGRQSPRADNPRMTQFTFS